ncbi:ECF RNA polymerase sigma factor SigJ [compost metagenome]
MNSLTRPYSASSMEDTEVLKLNSALQRYCLSLTRSPWEADDLVQDAWLKALAPIRAGHANPEALLLRTARNAWLDRMRRQAVLLRKLPLLAQQQDLEAQQDAPSDAGLMEEAAFRTLARELSPLQRSVFLLRDVLDYSASETAELLGTSEGAAKAALHRARRALLSLRAEPQGEPPAPADEAREQPLRGLPERMADAYRHGRVAELVRLIRQDAGAAVPARGDSYAPRMAA